MRPLCRMFDINAGFGQVIATSRTVYANFRPVALMGDILTPHLTGPRHAVSKIVTGSPTVFVEGRPVARLGSIATCGHKMITGSFNIFTL
jgi:uncharacterized Zn-binding protein involved in type VI secretion